MFRRVCGSRQSSDDKHFLLLMEASDKKILVDVMNTIKVCGARGGKTCFGGVVENVKESSIDDKHFLGIW